MDGHALKIWRWLDAPDAFRALSWHGGDEDWVLYVPPALVGGHLPMAMWKLTDPIDPEESYLDGYGHVDRHELPDGGLVVIFAHA